MKAIHPLFLACLFGCAAAPVLAQEAGPRNPGFEETDEAGALRSWSVVGAAGAVLSADASGPASGARSARLQGAGNMGQSIDATPWRGRRIVFRGRVRTEGLENGERAGLWLRVDVAGGQGGFFDSMANRPIRVTAWSDQELVADVPPDAERITLGLMTVGDGAAWIDDVSLTLAGPGARPDPSVQYRPRSAPGPDDRAPAVLTDRGRANLTAFARLLGYVRYFHPTDAAVDTDWETFAINGVGFVEAASDPADLANRLRTLFGPIAPTLEIGTRAANPDPGPSAGGYRVWRHRGVGADGGEGPYRSEGAIVPAGQPAAIVDLGVGLIATVPTSLPVEASDGAPSAPPPGARPASFIPSGFDRDTRLAGVALLWNVLRHFYPYDDVVGVDWDAVLASGLDAAATDADDMAFQRTVDRMVVALQDGHGYVSYFRPRRGRLPIAADWIEGRLVVTAIGPDAPTGVRPGDVIATVDGVPAGARLDGEETRISGSPQWRRNQAIEDVLMGAADTSATLGLADGRAVQMTYRLMRGPAEFAAPSRPEPVTWLSEGTLYVDLSRISGPALQARMEDMTRAAALIFDLRGYPNGSVWYLANLTDRPIQSANFELPIVTRPDADRVWENRPWRIQPATPRLTRNVVFLQDERAISFAESILGTVSDNDLATTVGEPTAGANGNVNEFALPGGYLIRFTGMRVTQAGGVRLHGVGLQPDVPVAPTIEGVRAGRDEVLEAAVALTQGRP